MSRARRFVRLPPGWEDLGEEELERLCDRAERLQGMLPELPPLSEDSTRAGGILPADDIEEEEPRFYRKRGPGGNDRETSLEQSDERGE